MFFRFYTAQLAQYEECLFSRFKTLINFSQIYIGYSLFISIKASGNGLRHFLKMSALIMLC